MDSTRLFSSATPGWIEVSCAIAGRMAAQNVPEPDIRQCTAKVATTSRRHKATSQRDHAVIGLSSGADMRRSIVGAICRCKILVLVRPPVPRRHRGNGAGETLVWPATTRRLTGKWGIRIVRQSCQMSCPRGPVSVACLSRSRLHGKRSPAGRFNAANYAGSWPWNGQSGHRSTAWQFLGGCNSPAGIADCRLTR